MFCEKCGKKLYDGDIFCGECGHRVPVDEEKTTPVPKAKDKPILDVTAPMEPISMSKNEDKKTSDLKIPVYNQPSLDNPQKKQAEPEIPVYNQENMGAIPGKEVKVKKTKEKKVKEKKKFDGRNVVIIILIIALLAGAISAFLGVIPTAKQLGLNIGIGGNTKSSIEGKGYSTPEKAVEAYITAINNGDIDGMVSTFAIESYVDNFDMKAHLDAMKFFQPTFPNYNAYPFTKDDDFSREIRISQRESNIRTSIYSQIYSITLYDSDYEMGYAVSLEDPAQAQEFIDNLFDSDAYEDWKNMEFVEFADPDDIFDNWDKVEEGAKKSNKNIKKYFGAEDIQDVAAVVEARGEEFYQFFMCVEYDGKWYIGNLGGTLSSIAGIPNDYRGLYPVDEIN